MGYTWTIKYEINREAWRGGICVADSLPWSEMEV